MNIEILPGARDDLWAGYRFYERQSPGIGKHFYDTLCADIEGLRKTAGIHPVIYGSHRALSRRFPYGIFYEIKNDTIRVQAVYDCRRRPSTIRRWLTGE